MFVLRERFVLPVSSKEKTKVLVTICDFFEQMHERIEIESGSGMGGVPPRQLAGHLARKRCVHARA